MLHALITQREGHNMYGKYTDVLEAAYVEFYESLGIRLRPGYPTLQKTLMR